MNQMGKAYKVLVTEDESLLQRTVAMLIVVVVFSFVIIIYCACMQYKKLAAIQRRLNR